MKTFSKNKKNIDSEIKNISEAQQEKIPESYTVDYINELPKTKKEQFKFTFKIISKNFNSSMELKEIIRKELKTNNYSNYHDRTEKAKTKTLFKSESGQTAIEYVLAFGIMIFAIALGFHLATSSFVANNILTIGLTAGIILLAGLLIGLFAFLKINSRVMKIAFEEREKLISSAQKSFDLRKWKTDKMQNQGFCVSFNEKEELVELLKIEKVDNKLNCWVQERQKIDSETMVETIVNMKFKAEEQEKEMFNSSLLQTIEKENQENNLLNKNKDVQLEKENFVRTAEAIINS